MMSDRIFHYTTTESLAYIISSRRIRFTRLDQFDDVLEARTIGQFRFGEMLFASSWVASSVEDYPQWSMYGDAMRGVRLALPKDMFEWHDFIAPPEHFALRTYVPMPMSEALGQDFMVHPFLTTSDFCKPVAYVDDVGAAWESRTWTDGKDLVSDDPRNLACFKDKRWEFQSEHRFVIQIHGLRKDSLAQGPVTPNFTHFDIPISQSALQSLEVTLGPLRTDADRLIVDALLAKYAPKATVNESSLLGAIRAKRR